MKKEISKEIIKNLKGKKIVIVLLPFILIAVLGFYFRLIRHTTIATQKYNDAVAAYNEMSVNYDKALSHVYVDNIDGIASSAGKLEKENEDIWNIIKTIYHGNTADKINKDTATIYKLMNSMEKDLKIVSQISNPSSNWVVERLKKVRQIIKTEVVSADNDPNQMLGKDGGYSSCTYFTITDIDSDSAEGDTVVAKGTDAGGAIEVFKSVEDAEARCKYLAEFDNTLLYSGSYAIVGTMVIRTSYRLDGKSQLNLTNEITKAFTMP